MNLTYDSLINQGQYSQLNVGPVLANSTAATDVSPGGNNAGQALGFPGGYMQAGMQFRIRVDGIVSTTGTPNLTLGLYWGGVAGTPLATTGTTATTSALTNNIWRLEADMRCESSGTSGSLRTIGSVSGVSPAVTMMPTTSSGGNAVTVDTSVAKILTIGATWGTASASNSIQVVIFAVEHLNEGAS